MRRILLLLLALSAAAFPARAADDWKEYLNARFGFLLRYPAGLVPSREPDNGDGREFHTRDGEFSVAAFGHFLMTDDGDSLEKRWKEELAELGDTVTYRKKAATWYVVSGVRKDGTEYYHKLLVNPKESRWAAFRITYPHAKNKKYDPWVARIEKSFSAFEKPGADRIVK